MRNICRSGNLDIFKWKYDYRRWLIKKKNLELKPLSLILSFRILEQLLNKVWFLTDYIKNKSFIMCVNELMYIIWNSHNLETIIVSVLRLKMGQWKFLYTLTSCTFENILHISDWRFFHNAKESNKKNPCIPNECHHFHHSAAISLCRSAAKNGSSSHLCDIKPMHLNAPEQTLMHKVSVATNINDAKEVVCKPLGQLQHFDSV